MVKAVSCGRSMRLWAVGMKQNTHAFQWNAGAASGKAERTCGFHLFSCGFHQDIGTYIKMIDMYQFIHSEEAGDGNSRA